MNLTFRVRYATQSGQSLWLAGQNPLPGQLPLYFLDRESWQATVSLPADVAKTPLNYSYLLRNPDVARITDWGCGAVLVLADYHCEELLVIDSWNACGFLENAFYSKP